MLLVEIYRHEELTVLAYDRASLYPQVVCPKSRFIRIIAVICFSTPGVSHLDKLDDCAILVCDFFHAQDSVRMSVGESYFILPLVVAAKGSTLNDIVVLIRRLQGFPKSFFFDIFVLVLCPRGAVECLHGGCRVAADDMFVVAMVLGKGFLKNGTIDRFIFTCLSI